MAHEADIDYLLARLIHFTGGGFHARAGFFAQMACEKYLKALTIQNEGKFADNSHKLLALAELCEAYDPYFSEAETRRVLERFDMFVEVGRYGGAARFDPLSRGQQVGDLTFTKSEGVQVAGATFWSTAQIQDLDAFVFRIRAMLDFAAVGWGDALQQILDGNGNDSLSSLWSLGIPLKTVLTHQNNHFRA